MASCSTIIARISNIEARAVNENRPKALRCTMPDGNIRSKVIFREYTESEHVIRVKR
jgi:hypothetical protein